MYQAAAVFEGGGMRGGYSTGVIDAFLDNDIEFSSIYGVSSGACHAASFVSKQRGRAYRISTDYLHDKNYCSLYSLITTGNLFGEDMLFRRLHFELDPFDFKTFAAYQGKFFAVATNVKTGKAEYLKLSPDSPKNRFPEVNASCSMPLLAKIVRHNGNKYLDGCVADSIPVQRAIADGNTKNVLVLTRPADYRKGFELSVPFVALRYFYYPKFVAAAIRRAKGYNRILDFIRAEEEAGKIFVIRPKKALPVGVMTKDKSKLELLYRLGYEDTAERMDELLAYLKA
mgnify:CR=1 FL=1